MEILQIGSHFPYHILKVENKSLKKINEKLHWRKIFHMHIRIGRPSLLIETGDG